MEQRYFETERLIVREWLLEDITGLFKVMCNPLVHTYTKDKDNPWDMQRTEKYIQFMIEKAFKGLDNYHGAVIEKETNQIIGLCGLNPYKENEPEIEWKLGVSFWGKGYATELGRQMIKEAFATTSIKGIYGMAQQGNTASKRVLEKIGMDYLGNQVFRDCEDAFYYIPNLRFEDVKEYWRRGNMNNYSNYIYMLEDNAHLISMVPVEELVRFGYEIGLNENMKVLDLCCGYGTLLKVWSEAFGIGGVGIDLVDEFLSIGRERLKKCQMDKVTLIQGDVTTYQDTCKYDVVICSETIGSIADTLALGEKFLKPGGVLCYQKLYSKVMNPPQELIDFDEEVLPLSELNRIFNQLGYSMTSMASDTQGMWERYVINWSGKRDLLRLKQEPDNEQLRSWVNKWYNMYFDYRRQYEGQALFGLQRF